MELLTLPLAFGNVTLAATILVIALLVLTLTVEVGIFIIKKTLALDTEDAPDVKLENPLYKLINLLFAQQNLCYIKRGEKYYDTDDGEFWSTNYRTSLLLEEKAKVIVKRIVNATIVPADTVTVFNTKLVGKIILAVLFFDFIVLLLQISFLPTLCITLTFTTMFCIRTLAKRFYKGMKNHKDRLDGHDKDIADLKENK